MMTPLDTAHAAMEAAAHDDAARLQFYERLADSEMFLALEAEVAGETIRPMVFEVEGQRFALIFDSPERLGEFAEGHTPFVALSGRNIVGMLAGQGIGLGVNLMVAPSSTLLPADAVDWLQATLDKPMAEAQERPVSVAPPASLPERLLASLDTKFATMLGLGRCAFVAEFTYASGARGLAVAFAGAMPDAQAAMANAVSEALTFSGVEAGALDVLFLREDDPLLDALGKHGLRFDLPEPITAEAYTPTAPGSDPNKPPKLR